MRLKAYTVKVIWEYAKNVLPLYEEYGKIEPMSAKCRPKSKYFRSYKSPFKQGWMGKNPPHATVPLIQGFLFKWRGFLGLFTRKCSVPGCGLQAVLLGRCAAIVPFSGASQPALPDASRAVPAVRVQVRILGHLAGSLSGCNRGSSEHSPSRTVHRRLLYTSEHCQLIVVVVRVTLVSVRHTPVHGWQFTG